MKKISTYFNEENFTCPCCGKFKVAPGFLISLDLAREIAGVPFVINSGYRCEAHNASVGGEADSAHVKACAADIVVESGWHRWKIHEGLRLAGFVRIGHGKNFIHADLDPNKVQNVMWWYNH